MITAIAPGSAASLQTLHRFTDTGNGTKSHYALGASPQSELLQASDGNFYGTAIEGGSGPCPDPYGGGKIVGCGTIFRMTPQGTVTALYSFPYNTAKGLAPNGAYPTAGLIQGQDGYLYGVARGGGIPSACNEPLGCGTLFRISTAGVFTRLHQFCSGYDYGCPNPTEGGQPAVHLVQLPSGALCGTTAEGGIGNDGTVFCASTGGSVNTLYTFQQNGTDGADPLGALLVGMDGQTLYGTTTFGGAAGEGTVFALKGSALTVLHAFDVAPDTTGQPICALIFGVDGKLYGTTYAGNPASGIFSLNTDGSGFSSQNVFNSQIAGQPYGPKSGLLLASNGLMYGMTYDDGDGTIYSYNPAKALLTLLVGFNGNNGAAPTDALIEGTDNFLYGTTTLYGGSNKLGGDAGTIVRLGPALK
ncbi:MAG: hypothetical protein IAI50_06790 [Candidatus Eremiobacteraeota bacterium]|nr:hypothetical protein [Candidatus Eremiobacteraeota bacterium]